MIKIDEVLRKYDLRTNLYKKIGKAVLINSNRGKLILKDKIDDNIYNYLNSRSFNYYPKKKYEDDNYDIFEYLDSTDMPDDQKILDLINLVSLLHNKTTYFEQTDKASYQETYENISNNIEYLFKYYDELISNIETKVFMSPWESLLANNISSVFSSLGFAKEKLDEWYEMVKSKTRRRYAVIHNNLSLEHFIRNNNSYLISWDKAKIDMPIYDLYKLYKKYYNDFDFEIIMNQYEKNSPLLKEERLLLFVLIAMPYKLELINSLFDNTIIVGNLIEYITKTEKLISPYYSKNTEESKNT